MSGPTRRLPAGTNQAEAKEEQGEEEGLHRKLHNKEETKARSPGTLVAKLPISLNNQTILSPHRAVSDMVDSLPGRFPKYHDLLDRMPDTYVNAPYHLPLDASAPRFLLGQSSPTLLQDTGDFFDLPPQVHHQRIDSLTRSSLELDLLASAIARRRLSASLPSANNVGLEIQLAAAQRTTAALLYQPTLLRSTTHQPNQWPSSGGLEGVKIAFSLLPTAHPQPFTPPAAPSTGCTSALSSAARIAERALPFSIEEESQIPLIGGPELFPMVLHRALAELELVEGGRTIATFLPDGRSFCIKNQARFAKQILPVFFPKMKGFSSFQRQLNLYDFERVGGAGANRGAYRHKLFVRDQPAMSSGMRRTKNKGHSHKRKIIASSKKEGGTKLRR